MASVFGFAPRILHSEKPFFVTEIPYQTLAGAIAGHAARQPEKAALADERGVVSYADLCERIEILARHLLSRGLQKGERVAILARKRAETVAAFVAAGQAGGVAVTLDYTQPSASLKKILELVAPTFLILVESEFSGLAEDFPAGIRRLNLPELGSEAWNRLLPQSGYFPPPVGPDDPCYLNMTSGSTGQPKAAVASHANIYWNSLAAIQALKLDAEDRHLTLFPIYGHPHEIFARAFYLGGCAILADGVFPQKIAQLCKSHKPTTMMAATTIYQTIARSQHLSAGHFSDLKVAECGGMHLPSSVALSWRQCSGVDLTPVWGSTETTGIVLAQTPGEERVPGSAGKPCPSYEVSLIREDGEECEPGENGEFLVRGPGVVTRYLDYKGDSSQDFRDGWFHTGDIFSRDAAGRYFFAGRKSGMMKVAGLRVYPVELEEVLSSHPAVAEVAVVGERHPIRGEVPKAFVVLREGQGVEAPVLRAFCEERLASYKIPRTFEFLPALPRTPGGKIVHAALKTESSKEED